MNEFIEQFLIESRELVEQATGDLLVLEQHPADAARLDSAFRAFHTLKGAAGIVEFPAMGRALHAAEEVLVQLRNGAQGLTPSRLSDCLYCLDQVVQWLDAMQASGQPPGDAEAAADLVVARFIGASIRSNPEAQPRAWLDSLLEKGGAASTGARVAIRYSPDPECFFRGEDPLQLLEDLPGLLTLDLAMRAPPVSLEALAPFDCRLVLLALSDASLEEVTAFFQAAKGQLEIRPVSRAGSDLPAIAEALITAQIQLLTETGKDGFDGRVGSAGRVAANVLRHAGFDAAATEVEKALAASRSAGDVGPLTHTLERLLHKEDAAEVAPVQAEIARSVRLNVERIDALVKLTGELTVAKNAIGHLTGQAQQGIDLGDLAGKLKSQHAFLERLVTELQSAVLGLRVLPLRHVFQRFPRVVREIAAGLGKSARLVIAGEETDADKAIVENLFEPLVHVLRNAIDHGVEAPEARIGLGKPASALIRLTASRQGEHVVIEVADDGGGIDVERVREAALRRGLASAEALQAMKQSEIADLIFAPGFSTARQVTDLSGRGVGMDAVRTAVARMGGRVTLDSTPGRGVTVRFILPFAILLTDVITVEAGGQAFGIPLDAVVETVRLSRAEIMPVGAARAFVLRNRTIPLIDLGQLLGRDRTGPPGAGASVVVTSFAGQFGGIEVDRLGQKMQVMLKPMDGLMAGTPGLAGTSLLGDGRVLLVLDVPELLR